MKYEVVTITTDTKECPEHKEDTTNNPDMIPYVEDECQTFVKDENGKFCDAGEFFFMNDIKTFVTEEK